MEVGDIRLLISLGGKPGHALPVEVNCERLEPRHQHIEPKVELQPFQSIRIDVPRDHTWWCQWNLLQTLG